MWVSGATLDNSEIAESTSNKRSSLSIKSSGGYPVINISVKRITSTLSSDKIFLIALLARLRLPSISPTMGFSCTIPADKCDEFIDFRLNIKDF